MFWGGEKGVVSLAGVGVVLYSLADVNHPEAGTGSNARRRAILANGDIAKVFLFSHDITHLGIREPCQVIVALSCMACLLPLFLLIIGHILDDDHGVQGIHRVRSPWETSGREGGGGEGIRGEGGGRVQVVTKVRGRSVGAVTMGYGRW